MMEVWIAIDEKTNMLVGFGDRSKADIIANGHRNLSGNKVKVRLLKVGMTIYE